jgi:glycosyltransferase involved in cell wall biosynthesis
MGDLSQQTPDDATSAPLVSVIVPVRDDAEGVATVLGALLEQRYPVGRYEILVTDNGSRDGTRDVVKRQARLHPDRVRLLTEFEKPTSYAARNAGIAAARGSILAFTDADCVPEPDWLRGGVDALESTGAAYAAGAIDIQFRNGAPGIWEFYDAVGKLKQREYMEEAGFGATANLFVRRSAVAEHGTFCDDLVSGGDYEYGRRLARAGELGVYAPEARVRHPARSTAAEVLGKERRILRGRNQLEARGLLEHGQLTWRSFVPVRRCPPLNGQRPGLLRRVEFVVVANFVRYYTLMLRLRSRWAGESEGGVGSGAS